jgi:hypothetical protein
MPASAVKAKTLNAGGLPFCAILLCACLTGFSQTTNSFFQFVQNQSQRQYTRVPHKVLAVFLHRTPDTVAGQRQKPSRLDAHLRSIRPGCFSALAVSIHLHTAEAASSGQLIFPLAEQPDRAFQRVLALLVQTTAVTWYWFFAPPSFNSRTSPCFRPRSCSPSGDCGVITNISRLSCRTSVPPARGPMK